ncbi:MULTISPECIES: TonB-dependent siderophore receptor [unclassified Colwellia]|uniref:TonB-dependent receptor plug domain-containing protein n=1 Tax=unclassified Colwellia TaxID=196834 RepID=UPI0015F47825|nr:MULTISPECIES: TonB-dependent receptor [unclassified Colwellia]MBA6380322.1 TonB-dependent receptor [Colwellia sp. BRX10-7]MBA6387740.1 TonB-dependent receptor [Colwellia sp. BRX10-2]MBA6402648.1 TonB-dependent receptor [Colwellia sp. BRX10-5]MBA6406034.1 TonB-dependent receptor [Colwellia sp. BRX10-1]
MTKASPIAKAIKYALLAGVSTSMLSMPVFAEEVGAEKEVERISVTGSRLKKAEFSNASPIHVITAEDAMKAGVRTVADLLQNTSMANGQQFDGSYNSNSGGSNASEAPPSGGVGSSNVGLRGLGPERTLILINGRRLGSSGVRGAPSQPDLSLIPVNMVQRIEVITEGASSIYGADAVAGVINIILKESFDGFEVSANISDTQHGGGATKDFSFITGFEGKKSKFTLSASYYERDRIAVKDRTDCIRKIFEDDNGKRTSVCSSRFWDNSILDITGYNADDPNAPVMTYPHPSGIGFFTTPGSSDVGIPGFSSAFGLPIPNDPNIDITSSDQFNRRIYSPAHSDAVDRMEADLIQPVTRFTLAVNGSYSPDFFGGDEEIFYEGYYFHRNLTSLASTEQIYPTIAANIPHEDANGNLVTNPDGSLNLVDNPLNPFPDYDVSHIMTLEDLPQKREVELNHFRFVTGLRGDFTSDWLSNKGWSYEVFVSYDRGVGDQTQPVMNETNLALSLGTLRLDNAGNPICGINAPAGIGFITANECVPVDFFAESIFNGGSYGGGTFATQAEKDFLIGTRINTTTVQQSMLSGFVTGDVFDFEKGAAATVAMGLEYRKDRIDSAGDMLGSTGLVAAENPLTEGATVGSRDVSDVFAEISLPIAVDQNWANLFEVEAALRYTDESNFGSELTNRARVTYKPSETLLFSTSYGTSFRAPNLREQFLANQFGGVSGSADPCMVSESLTTNSQYDPSKENRSQTILDNCSAQGADFTQIGLSGVPSIPTSSSGNAKDLKPETSENFTATFKWTPVFEGDYEFNFGVTYFSLVVEDTIRTISAATILKRCFDSPNMESSFCPRISRNSGNAPVINFPNLIDTSFINIGEETSKGVDVNTRFVTNFDNVRMTWDNQYTLQTEREVTIFKGESSEDLLEDFGTPEHRLVSTLNFSMDEWNWMIMANYMSGTQSADDVRDTAKCDVFIKNEDLVGKPQTVPVCSADSAVYVNTSVTYTGDDFLVTAGMKNVFDKAPELVDLTAGSNRGNMVTSSGYDLYGRSFFLNASYRF